MTGFGGQVIDILKLAGDAAAALAVAGTGTAYSRHFPLPINAVFGWDLQFTSSGAVDVKVELEQSNDEPTNEKASDTAYVLPDSGGEISSGITDELRHVVAYAPKVTAFARLKLTGQGSNHASTTLSRAKVCYKRG